MTKCLKQVLIVLACILVTLPGVIFFGFVAFTLYDIFTYQDKTDSLYDENKFKPLLISYYKKSGFNGKIKNFNIELDAFESYYLYSYDYVENINGHKVTYKFRDYRLPAGGIESLPPVSSTEDLISNHLFKYDEHIAYLFDKTLGHGQEAKEYNQKIKYSFSKTISDEKGRLINPSGIALYYDRPTSRDYDQKAVKQQLIKDIGPLEEAKKKPLLGIYDLKLKTYLANYFYTYKIYMPPIYEKVKQGTSLKAEIDRMTGQLDQLNVSQCPDGYYEVDFEYTKDKDSYDSYDLLFGVEVKDGKINLIEYPTDYE